MPRQQQKVHTVADDIICQSSDTTSLWQPRSHFNGQPSAVAGVTSTSRTSNCCLVTGRLPPTGSTSGRCSYGVSSPCSKLLPVAQQSSAAATTTTMMTSSSAAPSTTRTVHFRNVPPHQSTRQSSAQQQRHSMTLPRGSHLASQSTLGGCAAMPPPPPPPVRRSVASSGVDMSTRLRPPPPPTTTAVPVGAQTGSRPTAGIDVASGSQPRPRSSFTNGIAGGTVTMRPVPVSTIIV